MESYYYPDITESYLAPLDIIIASVENYPNYLGKDCPYSEDMKRELRKLVSNISTTVNNQSEETYLGHNVGKWDAVDLERMAIYTELTELGRVMSPEDTSEHLQIIKTRAGILDKLTEVGERAKWMKQLAEFRKVVLETMENVLDPDQRTEVMTKLRSVLVLEGVE